MVSSGITNNKAFFLRRYSINKLLTGLVLSALLNACSDNFDAGDPAQQQALRDSVAANASPGRIVARVDDQVIELTQVDQDIRLPLYDLERAQFDLRMLELRSMLQNYPAARQVEVLMQPPLPPRIELRGSSIDADGSADAPVTMALFCSYQSIHCVRQLPVWAKLREEYGNFLRWEFYDMPLRVHRFGALAANAARCAGDQGEYWRYSNSLFSFHDDLTQNRYLQLARQLGLNPEQFDRCLQDIRFREDVEADIRLGTELGLSNVPVVFVNGLYVSGPQPVEEYRRWIDWELNRMGVKRASSGATATPDEEALTAASRNDQSSFPEASDPVDTKPYDTGTQRPLLKETGRIEVSREWLAEQLENQAELQQRFQPAEHEVEGYRLMRLENVADSEFYQALGLENQDVLLRVGDQWLHEGENPLFESLQTLVDEPGEVSLVYMRRGLPQHISVDVR